MTMTDVMRTPMRLLRGLGPWRRSPRRFQPFSYTAPDRYPWLFTFVRDRLGDGPDRRLLSFGCSVGQEVASLRRLFPQARLKGIDIDPRNIAEARALRLPGVGFAVGDSTAGEDDGAYDAIFCLAVLCNGRLTVNGAERCDPVLHFATFQAMVADFARCLKPGGLLCLVTTNFRFRDTEVAAGFNVALTITPDQLAPDVIFGPDNRLMPGERYTDVVFVKR
ncbi:class I SAM-dependent methyltransferase [Nitrospirillum viridazoti]|uniref:SAM-dependent methyltransferase n=1 Tax=Nitrospirillum viridazoti CBAmc TaxID=1441467 RepID=A0A248K032_9PROT|nr:class I SAM-dependent methyltransferase [Nitrospirillum amazonense]ASG24116.1 SAM-dependent methyltransferase [Nitrospirillum amazonense CBAmc]